MTLNTFVLAAAAAGAVLSGCTPPPAAPPALAGGRQCFSPASVTGYQDVGEEALTVRVGASDVWRLDFEGSCPGVGRSFGRIVLQQRFGGGTICSGAAADVLISDAGVPRRCLVQRVRRLTPMEVAALPPAHRP